MRKIALLVFLCAASFLRAEKIETRFHFDAADEVVPATVLDNPLYYDAGIAPTTNGLWLAWLEYIPGQGDQLWIGLHQNEKWSFRKQISEKPGDYANPTPTLDALGRLWLSYEQAHGPEWKTVVERRQPIDFAPFEKLSLSAQGINHRLAVGPNGFLALVSQKDGRGRFQITADKLVFDDAKNSSARSALLQPFGSANAWHPAVCVTPDSRSHLIWDMSDGQSQNVFLQTSDGKTTSHFAIADSPAFEAHAQITADKNGKLYVSWEEDGENWGKHYLARLAGDKKSTRMADNEGPLHRFRKLHFAELDEKNGQLKEYELPQPSFDLANQRTNRPDGLKNFGVFYEKAQITVDGLNRPWIVYRHVYVPWIGLVPETHQQDNMKLYARCLLPGGWSKLYTFNEGQGDGMQRIHVKPTTNGIAVAYTIGRTDRRNKDDQKNEQHRGVALAEIHLDKAEVKVPVQPKTRPLQRAASGTLAARSRPSVEVASKKYELFFGDLHRHTDISLCFSPCDGTIEDAYRYAIDAAPLDFLAITDHTHDLDWGDGLSLIWHRSRKEVNRHALAGRFIPFYSYERSRADTDHNVISLRDKILQPHTYPLSQFWSEIDTNTFTIPHQPFNAVTWNYHDDAHRPLMEIYQGFRDAAKEEDAQQGLLRGHHFGFIAASDHLSTGASFACVWAEKAERESLFRAMQARRTYAATAKIQLRVTCGEHWMGERFAVKEMPPIRVALQGTDAMAKLDFFVDGTLQSSVVDLAQSASHEVKWEATPDKSLTGSHFFHIRVTQKDGNRAWSSPMWVTIQK